MTDRTDDALMIDYVRGDEGALRILVERWERPVFAFLARMLGSPEEAEDLCQDTFLKLIENAGRYRPQGRFASWLFRIAGNAARSRLRRRKVLRWFSLSTGHDTTPTSDPSALDALEGREERDRVRAAVARLPARQREALVLQRYQGMSYEEIAETMGATVASVQMLLHRAMTGLRRDLLGRRHES